MRALVGMLVWFLVQINIAGWVDGVLPDDVEIVLDQAAVSCLEFIFWTEEVMIHGGWLPNLSLEHFLLWGHRVFEVLV